MTKALAIVWLSFIVWLLLFTLPSNAYTCADVKTAKRSMSKEQQMQIRALMTPEQIKQAKACFHRGR